MLLKVSKATAPHSRKTIISTSVGRFNAHPKQAIFVAVKGKMNFPTRILLQYLVLISCNVYDLELFQSIIQV